MSPYHFIMLVSFIGIYKCCTADDSCKNMTFNHVFSNKWNANTYQTHIIGHRLLCFEKCSTEKYCVGLAYNDLTKNCSLYDIDVVNHGFTMTETQTNIFLSDKACGQLPTILGTVGGLSTTTYPAGSKVNYTCINGSYSLGSMEARCLATGVWDVPPINCSIAKTCHQAHQLGANVYPTVSLKPLNNHSAVTVNCEKSGRDVYTVAGHSLANDTYISGHEETRGYRINLYYNLSLAIVSMIVDSSAECEQFIELRCKESGFYYQGIVIRNGSIASYYAGGVKGEFNCACDLTNTCLMGGKCNCDSSESTSDSGYVRYKEDLPLTAFLAGDTGNSDEYLYLTIGSLRCKG